jgi:glycosyltransferase involved in cell wall biosynthesis
VTRPPSSGDGRLVVLTHSLTIGGGQLYLQQLLLRLMADEAFDVLVISPNDGPLRAELEDAGIAVHVTRDYVVDPSQYAGAQVELRTLIRAWGADAVLANTLGTFPAVDVATSEGIPTAWAVHESFELPVFQYLNWGERGLDPLVAGRMRHALKVADLVVFEARATLELFAREIPELRAIVVPYGVAPGDIAAFKASIDRSQLRREAGFAEDDIVLLCVGVFEPRKAILGLLAAFDEIAAVYPRARLLLVGAHRSPYSESVAGATSGLPSRERITIVEITPDIYPWYGIADAIVSASDIESLPRSLLEAMTFGMPVVAAESFGTSELVVDGVTGFRCEANSHVSLCAALVRLLSLEDDDRRMMGARATGLVTELGGQDYHRDYAALIRQLMTARRSAGDTPTRAGDRLDHG